MITKAIKLLFQAVILAALIVGFLWLVNAAGEMLHILLPW